METTTKTFRIEISIFGANSGWRRSIVTATNVEATDKEAAIAAVLSDPAFPNLTRADIWAVSADA